MDQLELPLEWGRGETSLVRDADIAVCFCGMPYVPADPDELHYPGHYMCQFCQEAEELNSESE